MNHVDASWWQFDENFAKEQNFQQRKALMVWTA